MCGRFTLRSRLNRILQQMSIDPLTHDYGPRYNIAPTQDVPMVRMIDGRRRCSLAAWGLVPSWSKDGKRSGMMINARGETIAEKPSFRTAFKKQRCLLLADGYYEWQASGKHKLPFLIHRKDNSPFFFAGLWEHWGGDEGFDSCTIVTQPADDLTRHLHDRRPVIVNEREAHKWLDASVSPDELITMLELTSSAGFIVSPANPIVNSVKNDVPECVEAPTDL